MGVILDVGLKAATARKKSVAVLWQHGNRRRFHPVACTTCFSSLATPDTMQRWTVAAPGRPNTSIA